MNESRPIPDEPTDAPPGSDEKIVVMRDRLADGFHLHHPLDNRLPIRRLDKLSGEYGYNKSDRRGRPTAFPADPTSWANECPMPAGWNS